MIYSTEGHLFSSTEAQDPTIAAEGPTGCKLEFRITLLSFYSGKMVLFRKCHDFLAGCHE